MFSKKPNETRKRMDDYVWSYGSFGSGGTGSGGGGIGGDQSKSKNMNTLNTKNVKLSGNKDRSFSWSEESTTIPSLNDLYSSVEYEKVAEINQPPKQPPPLQPQPPPPTPPKFDSSTSVPTIVTVNLSSEDTTSSTEKITKTTTTTSTTNSNTISTLPPINATPAIKVKRLRRYSQPVNIVTDFKVSINNNTNENESADMHTQTQQKMADTKYQTSIIGKNVPLKEVTLEEEPMAPMEPSTTAVVRQQKPQSQQQPEQEKIVEKSNANVNIVQQEEKEQQSSLDTQKVENKVIVIEERKKSISSLDRNHLSRSRNGDDSSSVQSVQTVVAFNPIETTTTTTSSTLTQDTTTTTNVITTTTATTNNTATEPESNNSTTTSSTTIVEAAVAPAVPKSANRQQVDISTTNTKVVQFESKHHNGSSFKFFPKFKSNKLEPLAATSSTSNEGAGGDAKSTPPTTSRSSKGKKLKRTKEKNKVKQKQQKEDNKQSNEINTTIVEDQTTSNTNTTKRSSLETSTTTNTLGIVRQANTMENLIYSPAAIISNTATSKIMDQHQQESQPNGMTNSASSSSRFQVIEIDASQLRKTSKVIFAVPQSPGQPIVPIAYKTKLPSQVNFDDEIGNDKTGGGGNGGYPFSLKQNLSMIDVQFEVIWRDLIYYHQANVPPKSTTSNKDDVNDNKKTISNDKRSKVADSSSSQLTINKQKSTKNRKSSKSSLKTTSSSTKNEKLDTNGENTIKKPSTTHRPTLNNITGSFRSGQMTAIMGPSGAGKTVFLNCITGRLSINARKENSGNIMINGVSSIRIGFVEQFDHLLPHLTIRETLLFASRIKNAARYYLNHCKIVDNVITRLDLTDAAECYAIDCSNGQRKRLSVAIELCFNSDILILDEPTTGLDSVTGFQIMNILKALTKRRRAISILATIHQPSTRMFELFDNLVVLSREGTIIYQGSPQDLPQTLSLVGLNAPLYSNISDFLLEVASGDFGRQSVHLLAHYNKEYNRQRFCNEDLNELEMTSLQEAVKRANKVNKRSFILCTWLLFIRTVICNWRNPFNTQIRIVSLLLCAGFLGIIFTNIVGSVSTCPPTKYFLWRFEIDNILQEGERQQMHVQENLSVVFMMTLCSLFNSMLNLVVTFPIEMSVFRREYQNKSYTIFSYYIAKLLGDVPFTIPTTTMFVMLVYRLTGQLFDRWERLGLVILPCCMVTFIGQLVGMIIGVIFSHNLMASVYSILFVIIPIIMFSGFFRLISEMSWIMARLSWVSFLKQTVNSIMIAIYGLGRCEFEHIQEKANFILRNISETEARPPWINSLNMMIDYQLSLGDQSNTTTINSTSGSSVMSAIKSKSKKLEPEEKLVRYMGLNTGNDDEPNRPLVLQHFDLQTEYDDYWNEICTLSYYICTFAVLLYVIMVIKTSKRN